MEIVGVGTEIVECVRIGRMIEKHGERFLARVFTPLEIRHCLRRKNTTERFAAQWAGKEAILKALGMHSVKNIAWTSMEIRHKGAARPKVILTGAVKQQAQRLGVTDVLIALAHCRAYATAYALAVK